MSPPDRETLLERRWTLLRELVVFSAKVAIEAIRDLILLPVVLTAGVVGLVLGGDDPERPFRRIFEMGARFDQWLNLFGEHDPKGPMRRVLDTTRATPATFDDQFRKLEAVLVEQHAQGGLTRSAKQAIDRALDAIQDEPDE